MVGRLKNIFYSSALYNEWAIAGEIFESVMAAVREDEKVLKIYFSKEDILAKLYDIEKIKNV